MLRSRRYVLTLAPRAVALFVSTVLVVSTALAAMQGPEEVVKETSDKVLEALNAENPSALKQNDERLYTLVEKIVLPHFDFRRMSMRVLGRYWRDATKEQRSRFVEEFKKLLVRTYSSALVDYANAVVKVQPVRAENNAKTVVVRTAVELQSAAPLRVNYYMYREDDNWKVYDVTVGGVSLVITYRSSFSEDIQRHGLDHLIEQLASREQKVPG